MMLIAGTAFFVVRALLALSPRLALSTADPQMGGARRAPRASPPISPFPAAASATVRSYVMALIMFGAILVDRPAISMRNLAIAAFIVLALEPEGVIEPGFQMSFARGRRADRRLGGLARAPRGCGWLTTTRFPGYAHRARASGRRSVGVALTTLIAGPRDRALRRLPFRARRDLFAARQPPRRAARLGDHHAVRAADAGRDAVRPRGPAARRHGLGHRHAARGIRLVAAPAGRTR